MDRIKAFFANAWERIRTTLPGILRNYPYSSAALLVLGAMIYWALGLL